MLFLCKYILQLGNGFYPQSRTFQTDFRHIGNEKALRGDANTARWLY